MSTTDWSGQICPDCGRPNHEHLHQQDGLAYMACPDKVEGTYTICVTNMNPVNEHADFLGGWKHVQNEVKAVNVEHGWWDESLHDAVRIALMHSELSEALEGLRHGNGPSDHIPQYNAMEEELADVIIRIMDIAEIRGYRVAQAVLAKIEFNRGRAFKHGGKKF